MATTIMISTRVKPDLRSDLIFIRLLFSTRGVNLAVGGFILFIIAFAFTDCLLPTAILGLAIVMPMSKIRAIALNYPNNAGWEFIHPGRHPHSKPSLDSWA